MKILTVVGARPQFIKASQVSHAIAAERLTGKHPDLLEEIVHTGQHFDPGMSDIFFNELNIPHPTVNLGIAGGSHGKATGEMLKALEAEIQNRQPNVVLVYGDTNSTLAGALASAKLGIPVAHIEAGERSYVRSMPEEINRVVTDHLSTTLFCVSAKAVANLKRESITSGVFLAGDLMLDAFLHFRPQAKWPQTIRKTNAPFVLATLHRAQNTDSADHLRSIISQLGKLKLNVILPTHPRTRAALLRESIQLPSNIISIEPASYFEMLGLLQQCAFVATDSGGLQKEAYFSEKRCLILRDETEWTELVEQGAAKIVGSHAANLLDSADWATQPLRGESKIFGTGQAATKIVQELVRS